MDIIHKGLTAKLELSVGDPGGLLKPTQSRSSSMAMGRSHPTDTRVKLIVAIAACRGRRAGARAAAGAPRAAKTATDLIIKRQETLLNSDSLNRHRLATCVRAGRSARAATALAAGRAAGAGPRPIAVRAEPRRREVPSER
ncbi:hypothetical protein EVAR_43214_1 [Eumeta japonica]|uniref:Uncharacterized protein n=1 Tax=Eumeta variegata TaxID=151549 RepID=A0A4C1WVC3_EUMVA|nr:hypothetical protein EVAR_43214_1 [Eumeta japonica]